MALPRTRLKPQRFNRVTLTASSQSAAENARVAIDAVIGRLLPQLEVRRKAWKRLGNEIQRKCRLADADAIPRRSEQPSSVISARSRGAKRAPWVGCARPRANGLNPISSPPIAVWQVS